MHGAEGLLCWCACGCIWVQMESAGPSSLDNTPGYISYDLDKETLDMAPQRVWILAGALFLLLPSLFVLCMCQVCLVKAACHASTAANQNAIMHGS